MDTALALLSADKLAGLQALFDAQRAAQLREPWADEKQRRDRLRRLKDLLVRNRLAICEALDDDFGGRPLQESALLECFPAVQEIRHNLRRFGKWMRPVPAKTAIWFRPGKNIVHWQPLGVVGIVTPWNFPVQLSLPAVANAFAAGNRVMLKPSEKTPAFASLLSTLVAAQFSPEEFAVVTGDVDVARAFTALPFDHLLFTGSTETGRQVAQTAAAKLTPVTLELGGKSPAVLMPDAPMKTAAQKIMLGKLFSAGQVCVSPDYVLLPVGKEQAFVAAARAAVKKHFPDWQRDSTALIDAGQRQRLQALLDDAVAQGAQVIPLAEGNDSEQRLIPRVLLGCTPEMRILQDEIFGPLLPVLAWRALPDVVQWVNSRPAPLACYVFGAHANEAQYLQRHLKTGGFTFNDTLLHVGQSTLPFGGIGASGQGAYHGEWGFRQFSKPVAIHHASRFQTMPLLYPPFGKLTDWLIKLLVR